MFAAAPLFEILVPLPITEPTNAPKDATSPAKLTSALTRQLSSSLLPATVPNITPEFTPEALNAAPFAIVTETFFAFALSAFPSTADERSVFETKLIFETVPQTSVKTGAETLTVWPFPSRIPLKEKAEPLTEISLLSSA